MRSSLLQEVLVTQLPTGAHYRLPPRRLGVYRCVGLALLLFGLLLCSTPIIPAWNVIQAIGNRIPADIGLFWLGAAILSLPFCQAGLYVAPVGLFIFAGHSEVELRESTLVAIECCGPLHWRWERTTAHLRRFFVSEGLESLNLFGKISIGPLGSLCVITPEWKPVVGDTKAKPMWLAPGYPRSMLVALATELSQLCPLADPAVEPSFPTAEKSVPAGVPVLEQAPDFSEVEELAEQPSGSRITVEHSSEGLRLIVPPGIGHGPGWYFAGGFLCLMAFALSTMFFEDNAEGDMPLWLNVLLFAAAGIGGIAFIVAQFNLSRRRVELAVRDNSLFVLQTNLFGATQRQWWREDVADVFVLHHLDSDGPDHWELRIQPLPDKGEPLRLLAYQDVGELRWLATVLRHALDCPCDSNVSPAPGLVVFSPMLLLRSRDQERSG